MARFVIRAAALMVLCIASAAQAQSDEDVIQILRQDIRTTKNDILTRVLNLSEQQSAVFWPLHREYEAAGTKIWDDRLALINEYVSGFETLGEDQAKTIAKRALDLEQKQLDLRKSTFKKLSKELSPSVAGRWLQTEGALQKMLELKTGLALPVVYTKDAATRQ
jgi:hypothetical protein